MTNIQIDGQIIKSSIDRSKCWAKVYGRPVSVVRAGLARDISAPERYRTALIEADAKYGRVRSDEDMALQIEPMLQGAKKAEKELAKIAHLADDFIIWEKAGYNGTYEQAVKAKPHNFTLAGTVFRVVKVSDVMVD
jgi:hypothetical protein